MIKITRISFMKRISKMSLLIAGFMVLSKPVIASNEVYIPDVKANTFVYDDADMIDADTEAELNRLLGDLESSTTAEVAVISYNDSSISLEKYANTLFNTLGIGKASKDNGVLLLMQKTGNHVRLEIGSGIDDIITDEIAGELLDTYYVPYRDYDTSKSALETTKAIASNLYSMNGIENDLTNVVTPIIAGKKSLFDKIFPYLVAVGFGVYFSSGFIYTHFRKKKWKREHNGSLAGYDRYYHTYDNSSSSGFSDFGGGSSDGGGASR